MARVAQGVTCSDQDRKKLERLSNSRTGEARHRVSGLVQRPLSGMKTATHYPLPDCMTATQAA